MFLLGWNVNAFTTPAPGTQRVPKRSVVSHSTIEEPSSEIPHVNDTPVSEERKPFIRLKSGRLPPWLRNQGLQVEESMNKLYYALRGSYFTATEARRVQDAIERAADGDHKLMAGAAEFCMILVDAIEFGFDTVIAAVFHYCACARARAMSLDGASMYERSCEICEHNAINEMSEYGEDSVKIAKDAGKLKKFEMMFASMVENNLDDAESTDARNLRNLLLAECGDWRALVIRSAACVFRLKGLLQHGVDNAEARRTASDALLIFAPLASRFGMFRLKNEIEDCAFRVLRPKEYSKLMSLFDESASQQSEGSGDTNKKPATIKETMQEIADSVSDEIREMLKRDVEFTRQTKRFKVYARVKEPYSMWRKMERKDVNHIFDVPDAVAFRVVLDAKKLEPGEIDSVTVAREKALCYYVREKCVARWAPLKGNPRFKDYINKPKRNLYQSLHYTAATNRKGRNWMMEFQIRSGEMHKVAEYGLAAHWDYKSQSQDGGVKLDPFVRAVKEWELQHLGKDRIQWKTQIYPRPSEVDCLYSGLFGELAADRKRKRAARFEPYIEALAEMQSDLARDKVFVFLSQNDLNSEGTIISLPKGSCVLDVMLVGEREFGMNVNFRDDTKIIHNGGRAAHTKRLRNGDVVTLPLL